MLKPKKLNPGDTVAIVSLSWGGPGEYPQRYLAGKQQLEAEFQIVAEAMPNALRDAKWLAANPEARADDLHQAFQNPRYKAVISSIGGDDSIRLLPHLNFDVFRANPKIFLGYSDTTVSHFAMLRAGLVSFYGPSIMAGFGENGGIPRYLAQGVRDALFSAVPFELKENIDGWTVEHLDWGDPSKQSQTRKLNKAAPWRWLQGTGTVEGHLIGGCLEVLDWLRGTVVWPAPKLWEGAIIFLETSEEAPSPLAVQRFLRCLGAQGILQSCAGILVGRPGGQIPVDRFHEYDNAILAVATDELKLAHLPIITNMDFGHSDPIMTLPLGVRAKIDCASRKIALLENCVTE